MAEQELRDLEVRRNDIALNETGDLAFVDGIDSVKQSAALDVRDAAHFNVGSVMTSDAVFQLQGEIERSLQRDPQLTNPVSVGIQSVDKQSGTVAFHVETRDNEEFTVDMAISN